MDMPSSTTAGVPEKQTIYVWDLPVRITHWVNVMSIVVLSLTGYYISNPLIQTHGVATNEFLMGTIRFIHFTVAFVFTMSVLFRIYWAFRGNQWARWRQFLPTSRKRLRELRRMLQYYTFFRKEPPEEIGHNPLAGATYIGLYLLFMLQIVAGFALYSIPFHDGVWKTLFGWIVVAFGEQPIRLVHDIIMFLIIAFTIHHAYSAVLIDLEEHSGLVSSIVTGWKSLTPRYIAAAKGQETPRRSRLFRRGGRKVSDGNV